jgi:hypothetical protein
MKIDEAIEIIGDYAPNRDKSWSEMRDACLVAIQSLQEKQEGDKNEPLTIEELKLMNGEPVWIVSLEDVKNNPPFYAIVDRPIDVGVHLIDYIPDDFGSYELYTKTWLAYRQKVEAKE